MSKLYVPKKKNVPTHKKGALVEFLLKEIPNVFDDVPRRAMNRQAVEKLVEKILEY